VVQGFAVVRVGCGVSAVRASDSCCACTFRRRMSWRRLWSAGR